MNVKIKETKTGSETSLKVGNTDCMEEGLPMYRNKAILFPVKTKPANNEPFVNAKKQKLRFGKRKKVYKNKKKC